MERDSDHSPVLWIRITVDPHHFDAYPDVDPDSTNHPDADPDPDFYLMRMRIQVTKMMRIRIRNTATRITFNRVEKMTIRAVEGAV
jgi:hypothetical protein